MAEPALPYYFQREFLVGLLIVILSFAGIGHACREYGPGFALIDGGVYTTGQVVDVNYIGGPPFGRTARTRRPVATVEFTSRDGQVHRYRTEGRGALPWSGQVGQQVGLRYLPSNPAVFEIGPVKKTDRAFLVFIISMLGLVGGIALMVLARLGLAKGMVDITVE